MCQTWIKETMDIIYFLFFLLEWQHSLNWGIVVDDWFVPLILLKFDTVLVWFYFSYFVGDWIQWLVPFLVQPVCFYTFSLFVFYSTVKFLHMEFDLPWQLSLINRCGLTKTNLIFVSVLSYLFLQHIMSEMKPNMLLHYV